jgi:hypothetical protein
MEIGSGFIHSFCAAKDDDISRPRKSCDFALDFTWPAWALQVGAFEFGSECFGRCVSRALFIPVVCKDKKVRHATERRLRMYYEDMSLTQASLFGEFPFLRKWL